MAKPSIRMGATVTVHRALHLPHWPLVESGPVAIIHRNLSTCYLFDAARDGAAAICAEGDRLEVLRYQLHVLHRNWNVATFPMRLVEMAAAQFDRVIFPFPRIDTGASSVARAAEQLLLDYWDGGAVIESTDVPVAT